MAALPSFTLPRRSVCLSASQPASQSVSQSVSQSTSQSININKWSSVLLLLLWSVIQISVTPGGSTPIAAVATNHLGGDCECQMVAPISTSIASRRRRPQPLKPRRLRRDHYWRRRGKTSSPLSRGTSSASRFLFLTHFARPTIADHLLRQPIRNARPSPQAADFLGRPVEAIARNLVVSYMSHRERR